jgi:hypothetical protein
MNGLKKIIIICLLAVGVFNCTAQAKPASVLLQEGLYAEEVEGDLDAAIKIYEQIITDDSAQRSHVAQALYRQGMCYYKKREEQKARAVLSKLVTDFSDHTNLVEKAKPLLEDLTNADPAALMPPETLIYMEVGSPGGQIETILNMLKGTPLENPLAIIGGGFGSEGPKQMNEWKSPADMMGAFMNPSMIAEFKKIRGAGIGVTGVSQNEPPALMILYPGKSDALRGLLLAALGMAGRPAEAIEGMQSVALPKGAGAVYDDAIIILATSKAVAAGQLNWCVKQYKGITNEPTLASSNKSFAKVDKKSRLENALTIWANVDQVFANLSDMLPNDQIPKEIQMANNFVDFGNVDDLIASFSINEGGVALETSINFMEGHKSLAYDLVRTPNLSKAGFKAIPPEAIALISHALGEAGTAQADAAGQKIVSLTGLDLGRELFANIEQITVFALDPNSISAQGNSWMPPIANCLGLAITSQNPQQTRQILTRLLMIANMISGQSVGEQPEQGTGRYQIELVGGQQLFCYMDQDNKTTVLSLNSNVIEASIAAINNSSSLSTSGSLKNAVSKLSPTTSKLVLLNVGGLIKLAGPNINLGPADAADETNKLIAQLAEAFDGTIARLLTDEQLNSLNIQASISGLPPVNEVFVPIMQLVQILEKSKSKAGAKMVAHASIKKTGKAPVIDGKVDDCWAKAEKYKIKNSLYESPSSEKDLSAYFQTMYDNDNLYLIVNVTDDDLRHDSSEQYQDDNIEIFIDADNSKSNSYGDNDYQYCFNWDAASPVISEYNNKNIQGIELSMENTDGGYIAEIKFPFAAIGVTPKPGSSIGLDVQVNDDDNGGDRDSKIAWCATQDNAWENPSVFGIAELAGLVGFWKLDESQGGNVSDSSGNNNNGSLVGDPQWKPSGGILGGALEFDGDGDYVEIENESNFDFAGQVTVAAWANVASVPMEWAAIVSKGDSAWRISTERSERRFHFAVDAGTYISGQKVVDAGEWHHVAGVYDGSQMRLYVDGQLDASGSHKGHIGQNDHPVYIGENAEQTGRFWHGLIDDVRIYNYNLSKKEIKALYDAVK